MKFFVAALLLASSALAGESGFLYNGETHVVYRDGQKVGKTAVELGLVTPTTKKTKRGLAMISVDGGDSGLYPNRSIFYSDDAFARCYYEKDSRQLSCLKK